MKYIISYDINWEKDKADYSKAHEQLTSTLKRLGAEKIQFSVWVLDSNQSLENITNTLTAILDKDDTILVAPTNSSLRFEYGRKLPMPPFSRSLRPLLRLPRT